MDNVVECVTAPLIVARCGDLQNAPESTLPAFEGAIDKGADTIEFDVHLTRDGELVVHHDYYLGRTNQGSGHIGDYTLDELRRLDAGEWFDARFAGERIPTLSQVLDLGRGKIRFEIDMRSPNLIFLNRLIEEITHFGIMDDVELTSAHVPLLFHVKKTEPSLRTGIFFYPLPEWMEPELGQEHVLGWMDLTVAQVAHLPSSLIEESFVEQLHNHSFLVHGSNLNTTDEMRKGILSGVDQFSTDHLEQALNIRKDEVSNGSANQCQ